MKILVLASRFPYPLEKGDKLRLYHQLRLLGQRHGIILVALSETNVSQEHLDHLSAFCKKIFVFRQRKWMIALQLLLSPLSRLPIQVAYFFDPFIKSKITKIIENEEPGIIYCQLIRMAPYLKNYPIKGVLDYMDAFSFALGKRQGQAAWYLRPFLAWEVRRIQRFEHQVFAYFERHTVISARDKKAMTIPRGKDIQLVPNGIDTVFFQPSSQKTSYELVLVGNMGYAPNARAALYLAEKVLPLVWETHPNTRFLIGGARPGPQIRALSKDPRITVSGWLEDIREAYGKGKIFVAPLFTGSGQQNKILEAMAMGLPCITTSMVQASIGAAQGTTILLADDPHEFAQHIRSLLNQPQRGQEIGKAASAWVREHFDWVPMVEKLERVLLDRGLDS